MSLLRKYKYTQSKDFQSILRASDNVSGDTDGIRPTGLDILTKDVLNGGRLYYEAPLAMINVQSPYCTSVLDRLLRGDGHNGPP